MMDDLISRQAAIEYFMANTNWHDEDGYEIHDAEDKRALLKSYFDGIPTAELPIKHKCLICPHCDKCDVNDDGTLSSAEPEIIHCNACKH